MFFVIELQSAWPIKVHFWTKCDLICQTTLEAGQGCILTTWNTRGNANASSVYIQRLCWCPYVSNIEARHKKKMTVVVVIEEENASLNWLRLALKKTKKEKKCLLSIWRGETGLFQDWKRTEGGWCVAKQSELDVDTKDACQYLIWWRTF